jgi:hypothetical protein
MGFCITSVTVSVEVADKCYGDGHTRFASIKSESRGPEEGIPLGDITKATIMTLDLLEQANLAVQATRYAQGDLPAQELNDVMKKSGARFSKIRKMLKEEDEEGE